MTSCPDARRKKICNRSNLMVVRVANFSATPQVGDLSFKHQLKVPGQGADEYINPVVRFFKTGIGIMHVAEI